MPIAFQKLVPVVIPIDMTLGYKLMQKYLTDISMGGYADGG